METIKDTCAFSEKYNNILIEKLLFKYSTVDFITVNDFANFCKQTIACFNLPIFDIHGKIQMSR